MPIDYDVDLIFYFDYWIEDPNAYEHDDLFYILGVIQLLMIYIYACCLGHGPLRHMIDEMFCVEWGTLEHMST